MNSIIRTFILLATSVAIFLPLSCSSKAQAEIPESYVTIASDGADLKSAPDAKSTDIERVLAGEIFRVTALPADGYVKARNIATGKEGYLDTMQINHAHYPLLAPELAETEPEEAFLLNIETTDNSETTTGWAFWKDGEGIRAMYSENYADTNGRVRANQYYYKGVAKDGYLLLTEEVQYGEDSGEKLEMPIIIWEDIAARAGVYVHGTCFTPGGQVGGFDTDDWE